MKTLSLSLATAILLSASTVVACPIRFDISGRTAFASDGTLIGDRLGQSVGSIGDFNGDGVGDFAAASLRDIATGTGRNIKVFSGRTGAQLVKFNSPDTIRSFGDELVALGDVTGDGRSDFAANRPQLSVNGAEFNRGQVLMYSAGLSTPFATLEGLSYEDFASSITSPGDLNGDGVRDLAVGAPQRPINGFHRGAIYIFSGSTRGLITTILNPNEDLSSFGGVVRSVGDVDGDGVGDFVTLSEFSSTPYFALFSGRLAGMGAPSLLGVFSGSAADLNLGVDAAALGDTNGDGRDEFLLIANDDAASFPKREVLVMSWTGSQIAVRLATRSAADDGFGYKTASVADINGDGIRDFAVAAATLQSNSQYLVIFSGSNGAELQRFTDPAFNGLQLTSLGDIDGNGTTEFLIGDSTDIRRADLTGVTSSTQMRDPESGALIVRSIGADNNGNQIPDSCETPGGNGNSGNGGSGGGTPGNGSGGVSVIRFIPLYDSKRNLKSISFSASNPISGQSVTPPASCKLTLSLALRRRAGSNGSTNIVEFPISTLGVQLPVQALPALKKKSLKGKRVTYMTGVTCYGELSSNFRGEPGTLRIPAKKTGMAAPTWLKLLKHRLTLASSGL